MEVLPQQVGWVVPQSARFPFRQVGHDASLGEPAAKQSIITA
jgi:hypothetical protein